VKAPLSWLRDYVDIVLPPEELASRLALTGTEVERVEPLGAPEDDAVQKHFVVGKVVEREKHPDADKLSVCRVDVGEESPRIIVCGAPNVAAGQTVAVVLPGAVLANGMKIGEAKLRGVKSSGMILSGAELGFEAKSEGIMVLPEEWKAGERLAEHLPVSDWLLDVEVTPNRPDCLSIKGLAREIAAITARPFVEEQDFAFPVSERPVEEDISIEVPAPDLCPRYAARVIRGVTVGPSPTWLKARITAAGMRPVNNVVDVTNYVMWSLGQPLHAFDLASVAGGKIIVRRAQPGEGIRTLDDTQRTLTDDMLVIADAEKPSVIAGIMGSIDSEVTDGTTDILLEAANFARFSILKTESALSLRSESSTRFEKGLDPNMIPPALDMACALLTELAGGEVSRGTVDIQAATVEPWQLELRVARVSQILGIEVTKAEMADILRRLGCEVEDAGDRLRVTIPTFRLDLEREIDLVEEVVRIYGLERLPATQPCRRSGGGGLTEEQRKARRVEDLLAGAGLTQAVVYSFIDPVWLTALRLSAESPEAKPVAIRNPLSVEQSVMRTMLLPGLLAAAARNRAMREERIHLFEVGRTFHPERPSEFGGGLPREVNRLGFVLSGPIAEEHWEEKTRPSDFYAGKGLVERLLEGLAVTASFGRTDKPFLHPGKAAHVLVDGEEVGWVGEVHPLVLQAFDLPEGVIAAELDLDALCAKGSSLTVFEDLITYPAIEQDLALVVDQNLQADRVLRVVAEAGGPLLREARVFDVYEGPQVGAGRRSLALRLTFRSSERTLSEEEINRLRSEMLPVLRERLGAELRS